MPVRLPSPPAAILALSLATGLARAQDRGGCDGPTGPDRIASIEMSGEVRLVSGRRLVLRDVRLTAPDGEAGPSTWLASLAGQEVLVTAGTAGDRWGRLAGEVALAERGGPLDLAEFLVAEGWGLVDPGERDALCRTSLLAVEDRARAGRVGIWRSGDQVTAATDLERLRALDGRFAVVEGRIVSVGERKERTYLNFGRDFARDFAVTIPRRVWATMQASGLAAADLRGRSVRVRGTVEVRRAPGVEIVVPALIERLDGTVSRPRRGRE